MSKQQLNRTGLYLRLSHDDEKASESLSIENQRFILRKFTEDNGGIIVEEYVDDGWSGTDFERPAVKRLLSDAKDGKIDTIVVKDLSRFGRNYIQVGQYIDYIFPAYGIRFIALSDNVDTADRQSPGMDMMPIMNVFNEWHAANTSKKIRAVLEAKWQAGKYTNWKYPYGYKISTDKNRTATIDEEAAKIVRRIYDMRLLGNSAKMIARTLTDEGIPNPSTYYMRLVGKKSNRCVSPYWSPKTVSYILKDQTYIGTLTQHRTTRFSYKNHKIVNVPQNEQIVRKNAHDPIISLNIWEKVQAINCGISQGRKDKANRVHPLSGLLICADCGKKLKVKCTGVNKVFSYSCRTYVDLGKKYCTSHSIPEKLIETIVLNDIRSMIAYVKIDEKKAKDHFYYEKSRYDEQRKMSDEKQLRFLKVRLAELDKLIQAAFEEKILGHLPENICRGLCEKYQNEKNEIECQLIELEKKLAEEISINTEVDLYIKRLKKYATCDKLTREMCLQLIEFITVGEKQPENKPRQIHIYYKLIQNQKLADYSEEYKK